MTTRHINRKPSVADNHKANRVSIAPHGDGFLARFKKNDYMQHAQLSRRGLCSSCNNARVAGLKFSHH